jgi:hypothetical protein
MIHHRVLALGACALAVAVCSCLEARVADADASGSPEWRSLFNGKDLEGWDTWLGKPYKGKDVIGLNKDPNNVYTVVMMDGKPAIRISGEIFGALTSREEFENYHLKLEFKWGEKRWPPREKDVRDSGLLYHCVGPHGASATFWMRSQECQIQEKDCGDYWSVAGGIVDVEAEPVNSDPASKIRYQKGGTKYTVPRAIKTADGKSRTDPRIIKSETNEKEGDWNTIELLCLGGTSVHVVNGKVVMILTNSRQVLNGKEVPLVKGKVQIQSEGAEVFYRNIEVRTIKEIPAIYLK